MNDQSDGLVMRIYPVEKKADEVEKTRAYVGLAIGAEPCGVVRTQNGVGIVVIESPNPGQRVPHALAMLPEDYHFVPLLGEHVGAPLGVVQLGSGLGPAVAVCPILPWPTSARKVS